MSNNKIIKSNCVLKYIYKLSPIELINNKNIADFRIELGKSMANNIPEEVIKDIDYVVPCPQTGIYYAIGLAMGLNKQYFPAIENMSLNQRYLEEIDADKRKKFIWSKLYPIKALVEGKKLLIVDEAIFTGLTLKILCEALVQCNVKKIYLCIPSPKCIQSCKRDIMPQKDMLLERIREDMLNDYFGVDGVFFQDYDFFYKKVLKCFPDTCFECFTNKNIGDDNE